MGDEPDSARKLYAIDPEKTLIEAGVWNAEGTSTQLAHELEDYADWLIDRRRLTGRYSGIDAYQAMLCALLENGRSCHDRRAEFATSKKWLLWLIGACVDEYGRHPEPSLGDNSPEPTGGSDVVAQADAQLRLEQLANAVVGTEFAELINLIHFRDNPKVLAEMLGMDIDDLRRLLARFTTFVKKFRS